MDKGSETVEKLKRRAQLAGHLVCMERCFKGSPTTIAGFVRGRLVIGYAFSFSPMWKTSQQRIQLQTANSVADYVRTRLSSSPREAELYDVTKSGCGGPCHTAINPLLTRREHVERS